MKKQEIPAWCQKCALLEHDAYICARWQLAHAWNELKKTIPLLRRSAVSDMRCPYFYAKYGHGVYTRIAMADEVTPWPPKGTEDKP